MGHATALIALHVAVALFGFAGLFGKWLALSPVAIVLARTAIAAVALYGVRVLDARLPFANVNSREAAGFDGRLAVNGIVLAAHWVSFFAAIETASVAIGLLGYASFPLFTLLFERVLLGRRWSRREGFTAALVVVGLAFVVPEASLANPIVRGLGLGTVSGATFALLAVLNRRWATSRAATDIAFWQNLVAALVLVPVAWAGDAIPAEIGPREILLLALLGLLCTALAHSLFIASLASVTAHTASIIAALEPVYGIVLAVLLLGESLAPRTIVGGALLVGAAIVATRGSETTPVRGPDPG
jgi:drug/metabolite transporter (DMT)-like permease